VVVCSLLFHVLEIAKLGKHLLLSIAVLHVIEIDKVKKHLLLSIAVELVEMLSSVVEPGRRAIRLAFWGMVTEVKTLVIRPQATSAELHELMHSVTVQPSFIVITQDPRSVHSSTGKQDQMPNFRAIIDCD